MDVVATWADGGWTVALQRHLEVSPRGWALSSPVWDPETTPTSEWCHHYFSGCWFQMFRGQSLPLSFSICPSQHWWEGKTNQNAKWLSDWKWQGEFTETSVFRRFLSKPSQIFPQLNCSCVIQPDLWYLQAHCMQAHTYFHVALSLALWNMAGEAQAAPSVMVLIAESRLMPYTQGQLWMVQEASHWLRIGFLCSLKPSCFREILSIEQRGVLLGLAFEYQEFSFPALEAWVGM